MQPTWLASELTPISFPNGVSLSPNTPLLSRSHKYSRLGSGSSIRTLAQTSIPAGLGQTLGSALVGAVGLAMITSLLMVPLEGNKAPSLSRTVAWIVNVFGG